MKKQEGIFIDSFVGHLARVRYEGQLAPPVRGTRLRCVGPGSDVVRLGSVLVRRAPYDTSVIEANVIWNQGIPALSLGDMLVADSALPIDERTLETRLEAIERFLKLRP